MAFDDRNRDRQMIQGNWTCSECGATITELPFEPSGDRPVLCRDCHRNKRDNSNNRGGNFRRERKMFEGNWKCSGCGAPITQLPFEPKDESDVSCRECYMKNKERN